MTGKSDKIRVLILEDSATDAELIGRELRSGGLDFESRFVQTREDFVESIRTFAPSVVLSDYTLPSFDGLSALEIAVGERPETPFIFVSGTIGDELAVSALKRGATDYVLKEKLFRLAPAVRRALGEAEERANLARVRKELDEYQSRLEQLVLERTEELARATDKLQKTLNSITDGYYALDNQWTFVEANRRTEEFFDLPAKELVGRNLWELTDTPRGHVLYRQFHIARSQHKPVHFETESIVHPGYWVECHVYPLGGGVEVYFRDISERKQAERIKDEFIGLVSHEIKTPLTVIIGALEVATSGSVPEEEATRLIGDASEGAQSLSAIVENLLEVSRYQSRRLSIVTETADLAAIAGEVVRKLRPRSAIHSMTLDIPPDIPRVKVDRIRIERVLYNLVENAIKYSPSGGEIRIFARYDVFQLMVGVSDQGMGISASDQSRLFQSFERIGAYRNHTIPGVGLGLRVCQILTEAHGGRIWVESEPDKGSTFFFTVPIVVDRHSRRG